MSDQLLLESLRGDEAAIGAGNTLAHGILLGVDPAAEVGVDQLFQLGAVERVIVDESREAVFSPVADLPDEGPLAEQLGVLGEEVLPKPPVEILTGAACLSQQLFLRGGGPFRAKKRRRAEPADARRQALSPATVGRHATPSASAWAARRSASVLRPAVAEETG